MLLGAGDRRTQACEEHSERSVPEAQAQEAFQRRVLAAWRYLQSETLALLAELSVEAYDRLTQRRLRLWRVHHLMLGSGPT